MASIVIGVIETVPKGLERRIEELEIRGKIKTTKSRSLLRSVGILRRVLES